MSDLTSIELAALDTALGAPVTETVEAFAEFLTSIGKTASDFTAWVSDVWEDMQNSFVLPTWYTDVQTWFGVDIAGLRDPLVIDTDGDGLAGDVIGTQTQYFDLDGDGFASATIWHKDAFLARDINENGRIDDGTELFGNATQNGFEALAAFDGNTDGQINSSDAIWADLILWKDFNSDGQTQSDELLTLASQNITAIGLTATATSYTEGLTHTGTVTTTTGTMAAGSYIFQTNTSNTRYAEEYEFDIRAAYLPNIRGYSQLPELSIAL